MFIFLAVFIIFVLILNFAIHKNNHSQENVQEQFWENERQANFTRRKDIHNLNYLTIPIEKIPQNLHTDAEKTLVRLSSDKMLNLSGITNTELKLELIEALPAAANLDELSSYDANFTEFVSAVNTYAQELLAADQKDTAKDLLELAVSFHADAISIYTTLADLYKEDGQTGHIQDLISSAEEINTLARNIIIENLKTYLP